MANSSRRSARVWIFLALACGGAITAFLLPPLRQPQSYHQFADGRTLLGIPNCLNVLSNLGFLVVGLMGLGFLAGDNHFTEPREKTAYIIFFVGACCTCFGSGYYHWSPRDATLAWDRLPMTLAFMSLLSATMAERLSVGIGTALLWPLVTAGAISVAWWRWTENLWPYMAAQYFSIFLIGWLMLFFPASYTRSIDILGVTAFYALAKIAEALDVRIYKLTGWISGHTIKHLIAALAVYWVLRMLRKRRPMSSVSLLTRSPRSKLFVN